MLQQQVPTVGLGVKTLSLQTILIVEDDLDIGLLITSMLALETPFKTLLVPDGFRALKILDKFKPSLLLLDYQLPGMNGIELYDHIHKQPQLAHIPVIMMSANLPTIEMNARNILGLAKPFEMDDMVEKVRRLIGSRMN